MVDEIAYDEKLIDGRGYELWTKDEWLIVITELEILKFTLLPLDFASYFVGYKFNLHEGAIGTLLKQMISAVGKGLVVRHPHTDIPYIPIQIIPLWERVRADELDKWFESLGVEYRILDKSNNDETFFNDEVCIHSSSPLLTVNKSQNKEVITGVFHTMNNLTFDELSITFVGEKIDSGLGNNMLEISARGETRRVALASFGLVNRRQGTLNSQGAILLGLAKNEIYKRTESNSTLMRRVRKALREALGMKGDPFYRHCKDKGWEPRFKLLNKLGASDERAKRQAELKTVSYDVIQNYIPSDNDEAGDIWMKNNGHKFID